MKNNKFSTDYYDYYLPEELIAQTPIKERSHSKLLVLDKVSGNIDHKRFDDIVNYLDSNDVLVLNNTKVLPSRIYGNKETGAKIETLLLKELNDNRGEEEKLESQIKDNYKLDTFVKINNNQIQVTVNSSDRSESLANNIMRLIQSNYKDSKYITVKFQK